MALSSSPAGEAKGEGNPPPPVEEAAAAELNGVEEEEEEAAAAARERLKADIMAHNVNVTFTRAYLDDKALLRGFRVRRWVEAQVHKLVDHVVELCEGSDEVDRAARAEEEEMQAAMRAMGWGEGQLPLSFGGGGAQRGRGEVGAGRGGRAGGLANDGEEDEDGDEWAPAVVGEECECLYEEDGAWYPARVEGLADESLGGGMLTVTYLGYDGTHAVPRSHVRQAKGNDTCSGDGSGSGSGSRKRKRPPSSAFFSADGGDEDPIRSSAVPRKYWMQRFRLFSQFDRGVRLDPEGWFSVTPERVAAHIAERSRCDVVVDLFAGCGGNVIQFARTSHRVLAVDIDAARLAHARHNAALYGVQDRVEFVLGDALALLPAFKGKVDVLFMSPPWGGPEYLAQPHPYRLDQIQIPRVAEGSFTTTTTSSSSSSSSSGGQASTAPPPPVGGRELLARVLAVCPNVAVLLPRNVDLAELAEAAGGRPLEVEENVLNYKLKTITAYFGDYFLPPGPPDFVVKRWERGGGGGGGKGPGGQQQQQQQPRGGGGKKKKRRGGRKRRRTEQQAPAAGGAEEGEG